MIRQQIPRWLFLLLAFVGLGLALTIYGYLSVRQTQKNPEQTVLPGPYAVAQGFVKITESQGSESNPKPSWLWQDFKASATRLGLGLSIGIVLSITLGVLMGVYPWVEAPLNPMITFFAQIPPTAMLPVYMIVFGTNTNFYVAIVALGIFFTMAQTVYQATRQDVSDDAIDKAYTLGASDPEVIAEIIWPQILPRIIETIRLQIAPAVVLLIAAEVLLADVGFGYRIRMESRLLRMNTVYWYLALLGIFGLSANHLLILLRQKLCGWFRG